MTKSFFIDGGHLTMQFSRHCCACIVALAFVHHAPAVTTSWISNVGGSFTDPLKWTNGVPQFNDTAVFNRNLNIQYNVTFPGRQALDPPIVYAMKQLRIGTSTVSFADSTNFGLLADNSLAVINPSGNQADRGIIVGDAAGQVAVLNTILKSFLAAAATIGDVAGSVGTVNVNGGVFSMAGSEFGDSIIIGNDGAGSRAVVAGDLRDRVVIHRRSTHKEKGKMT
ncbi:hypothetical protein Pla144_21750 [Bythopirellula polymerisocia]|uniref:Uncharacterized protein n=2 Tax=Bythopirellula polymerisocia TaxID=2528003 RepID=A0A5C6CSB8_9BACT|nr:hypothetical protein Pla144_21750 [Bythopirellula polymerisocia]